LIGLRALAPLTRTLTLPLTATVARTILSGRGALSLSLSVPRLTQRVAGGSPSDGTTGAVGIGVGVRVGVGVAVGVAFGCVGVAAGTAVARHWNPRLSDEPW
jgi:hypothetical protein